MINMHLARECKIHKAKTDMKGEVDNPTKVGTVNTSSSIMGTRRQIRKEENRKHFKPTRTNKYLQNTLLDSSGMRVLKCTWNIL